MERFEAWLIERPDSWIASSRSSLLCPLAKYLQEKIGIEVKANKSGFRYFPKDSSESVVVELPVWAQNFIKSIDAFKYKIGRDEALSAIRQGRQAERKNAVMIKPQPAG
jgi:hypothetical protein